MSANATNLNAVTVVPMLCPRDHFILYLWIESSMVKTAYCMTALINSGLADEAETQMKLMFLFF